MKTQSIVKQRKKDIFDQILIAHIDKLEKINKNINYKNFDNVLTKLRNAIERAKLIKSKILLVLPLLFKENL